MSSEELFEFFKINDGLVLVHMMVRFEPRYDELVPNRIAVSDIDWIIPIHARVFDEDQFRQDVIDTECWHEWLGDKKWESGFYEIEALFSTHTDGDDFKDWSWYELMHAEMSFAYDPDLCNDSADTDDGFDIGFL